MRDLSDEFEKAMSKLQTYRYSGMYFRDLKRLLEDSSAAWRLSTAQLARVLALPPFLHVSEEDALTGHVDFEDISTAQIKETAKTLLEKKQEYEVKRQKRLEEEKQKEAQEKREIQRIRKERLQCLLCGKPLGFIDKYRGRESHKICKSRKERLQCIFCGAPLGVFDKHEGREFHGYCKPFLK